jgi:hypothetical protein
VTACDISPQVAEYRRAYAREAMNAFSIRLEVWRSACGLAVLGLMGLSACASDDGAAARPVGDAGPFGTIVSESGALSIEARTGPDQPPTRGLSTVDLEIVDAQSGEPQDGLELSVVPWMPAMGHGTSVKPALEAVGGGHYVVSNVNLYMGGAWDLRIAISAADAEAADRATLHFKIR